MTVEELVYSIENSIDTCYIFKGVDVVKTADIHTDNKELKEYFDCKVKSFHVELIEDDFLGELYDLYITLQEVPK
ncbi:hypothetical protein X878_0003 [Enterococcus phage VD13]|uniref:Uncharacterized protein n=1 Tax=Enterococcus phage VD13 TaxID=1458851 RepID=X2KRQ5_9CAUD|nr:hypothetical protein X878_0003 [Enterococcus phage VD13]YP_009592447.1 hypothetical protein FDG77_gp06 [Enterococcus phage VD13]AHL19591.1 hypothetical protein VD13_006 [Enterococcus phage VD13]AHN83093.1 hypothetical protein X878_0003 [Enterococcus phage VD13]